MNKFAAILGALAVCSVGAFAQAGTIVNTGAPTSPFNPDWVLGDGIAARFQVANATSISEVQGFFSGVDSPRTYTIALYSDGADKPGTELFSTEATATVNLNWNGKSGLGWAVGPGFYWAAFEVRAGQTFFTAGMPGASPSPLVDEAFKRGSTFSAFDDLNVGVRIFDNSTGGGPGPIPEPTTWALMISGFGLAGAALRRRRAALVTA